jgi:hypothetical protein
MLKLCIIKYLTLISYKFTLVLKELISYKIRTKVLGLITHVGFTTTVTKVITMKGYGNGPFILITTTVVVSLFTMRRHVNCLFNYSNQLNYFLSESGLFKRILISPYSTFIIIVKTS